MHLDEAVVDTGSGEVVSNKPVAVFTQDATLNADRLEVEKSGEIVRFIGSVVMNLDSLGEPQQPAEADGGETMSAKAISALSRRCWPAISCAAAHAVARWRSPAPAAEAAPRPNALQGFQQNRGQPVQIEAARLEVRDKDKVATFTGNVKVVQGDTTMRCKVAGGVLRAAGQGQGSQAGASRGADHAGRDARPRRLVADQPAGGQRRRDRHPEGPDRHRRHRACST